MIKKYEFTGCEKDYEGHRIKEIRACLDMPQHQVRAGNLGGWIESDHNVGHEDMVWVAPGSIVYGDIALTGSGLVGTNYGESQSAVVYGKNESRLSGVFVIGDQARVSLDRSLILGQMIMTNDATLTLKNKDFAGDFYFGKEARISKQEDFLVITPCGAADTSLFAWRLLNGEVFVSIGDKEGLFSVMTVELNKCCSKCRGLVNFVEGFFNVQH